MAASRELPAHYARYFRALGQKIRAYRADRNLTQEDMITFGFSVRHWQMIEAGRPMNLFTLLRVCEAFNLPPETILGGLSQHLGFRKIPVEPDSKS